MQAPRLRDLDIRERHAVAGAAELPQIGVRPAVPEGAVQPERQNAEHQHAARRPWLHKCADGIDGPSRMEALKALSVVLRRDKPRMDRVCVLQWPTVRLNRECVLLRVWGWVIHQVGYRQNWVTS